MNPTRTRFLSGSARKAGYCIARSTLRNGNTEREREREREREFYDPHVIITIITIIIIILL